MTMFQTIEAAYEEVRNERRWKCLDRMVVYQGKGKKREGKNKEGNKRRIS